jgi:hypothetical protein
MQLNRHVILKVLGDVDEAAVAKVLATGASREELAQAQAWIDNDEPLVNSGKPLPAGRVAQLVAILTTLEEENSVDPVRP